MGTVHYLHRLAQSPASQAAHLSEPPELVRGTLWRPLDEQPKDYVQPMNRARTARIMGEDVDLYGSFRFEDEEPPVSEWISLARGAVAGLVFIGLAMLVLWMAGSSW